MRRNGLVGTLALCLMLSTPLPTARAGPVTFEAQGVVTEIRDPFNELGGRINLGDALVVTFSFSPGTADTALLDPVLGLYENAVVSTAGVAGSSSFGSEHPFGGILIANDQIAGGDSYILTIAGLATTGFDYPTEFVLSLGNPTTDVFESDALPVVPPPLDAFADRSFFLQIGEDRISVSGHVTGLIPEPGSLVLLGTGVWVLLLGRSTHGSRARLGSAGASPSARPHRTDQPELPGRLAGSHVRA